MQCEIRFTGSAKGTEGRTTGEADRQQIHSFHCAAKIIVHF